ncbi:MAG: ribosomal-protein-alanine N-acetyltransferase [Clostridiales bacterium]|nr:ribosomal-protein-alanine N-acetyltransferase [Clostridiales bacterium]
MTEEGKILYRVARPEDSDAIAEIDRMVFPTPWGDFRKELENEEKFLYVVAELNGKVIGFAGLWIILEEGDFTNVAIHPDHRGKGYGGTMLDLLLAEGEKRGVKAFTLEVRAGNERARSMYTARGFKEAGIRKAYYADNKEDALIMWRE